ncbi:MAG: hypothetical protein Q8R57_05515 [Bacteroidota bacterium]|nr:hypothetical protein [Bacteroidota bacterium]
MSVDIDLFGNAEINSEQIIKTLKPFGSVQLIKKSKNILILSINGIKVDFVNYSYPLLKPIKTIEGIRLISKEDIAAMKLNAIGGRGCKKDFIDLYFLLKEFSFSELLTFYNAKYSDGSEFLVRKSLMYFDDADLETSPQMIEPKNWEEIKKDIIKTALN